MSGLPPSVSLLQDVAPYGILGPWRNATGRGVVGEARAGGPGRKSGGWKGSGSSGKNAGGHYYLQLYMHEQIHTLIR